MWAKAFEDYPIIYSYSSDPLGNFMEFVKVHLSVPHVWYHGS